YELDAVDYLLKPLSFERFLRAIEKASQRLHQESPQSGEPIAGDESASSFMFVKDGTKLVKVRWNDIQYIEGLKDYVTIHTRDQKIVTLQRLKTLEEQCRRRNLCASLTPTLWRWRRAPSFTRMKDR